MLFINWVSSESIVLPGRGEIRLPAKPKIQIFFLWYRIFDNLKPLPVILFYMLPGEFGNTFPFLTKKKRKNNKRQIRTTIRKSTLELDKIHCGTFKFKLSCIIFHPGFYILFKSISQISIWFNTNCFTSFSCDLLLIALSTIYSSYFFLPNYQNHQFLSLYNHSTKSP